MIWEIHIILFLFLFKNYFIFITEEAAAIEANFIFLFKLNGIGPLTLLPIGNPFSFIINPALSPNLLYLVLTIKTLAKEPFLNLEWDQVFKIEIKITSPIDALSNLFGFNILFARNLAYADCSKDLRFF